MAATFRPTRRNFLKRSMLVGGGLSLGFSLAAGAAGRRNRKGWRPNAWLQIDPDDRITIVVAESEMGQGVLTSMAMLVAEELEADWRQVQVRQAPTDPVYGRQGTGGSRSVRDGWRPLREAGAAAREMLVAAAARIWGIPSAECHAQDGAVLHRRSGRRAGYGSLSVVAATLSVPKTVRLKDPADFRIIGQPLLRLDTPVKTNGTAVFGADVRLPGLLTASIVHCPVFGGRLVRVDPAAAMRAKGVRAVVPLAAAVAVVADSYWSAWKGQQLLRPEWDPGAGAATSSADVSRRLHEAAGMPGTRVRHVGDAEAGMSRAARTLEAVFETPYQAHATMEPMCCTADMRGDRCTIWAPTQQPTGARQAVAKLLFGGNTPGPGELARITVNTTYLGGGFGRRNLQDFVLEAVEISRAVRAPVRLVWSREEDMQHGYYHPATVHRLRAGIDRAGRLLVWEHRIAGSAYASGAEDLPYAVPNLRVETARIDSVVPVGPWRSVAHAYNAFAVECFIDELAVAAGKLGALDYRLALLSDAPRHRAVLELAADRAGWGRKLPEGHFHGLAVHASFGTVVAQVVELSVADNGAIRVHRVTCAVDCGIAINPDTVAAQMEGSVAFGLTAALKGQITIRNGRVEQSSFHDYPVLRMDEMPRVDTHILPSRADPGGIGEPGVPPLAPALANAVFAATGKRLRRLPFVPAGPG